MSVMTDIVEALLFASGNAIAEKDLVDKVQGLTRNNLVAVKKDLAKKYPKDSSGVVFLEFNGKLQFSTNPKYGDAIAEILTPLKEKELTKTLLEVLSTIAYKQPITKLELEDMRGGVSSDYAIMALQKAGLIEVVGRKDALGRPQLYGTTDEFLKKFELKSLEELPDLAEVMSKIQILYQPQQETLFSNRSIYSGDQTEEAEVVEPAQIEGTTDKSVEVPEEKPVIDPYDTDEKEIDEDDDIPDFLAGEDDIKIIE